jgi:hypothetical protein
MSMYLDKSTGWWRQRDDSDKVLAWFEMLHARMTAIEAKLNRLVPDAQVRQFPEDRTS